MKLFCLFHHARSQFGFQFVGHRFWVYLKWDSTKKDPHNERSGVWCCQFFWPEGNLIRKCFFQTRYWMTLQQGAWHCLTYSPDIPIAEQKGSWRICDLYCLYYSATLTDNVSFATPHMNLGRMIPQWECLKGQGKQRSGICMIKLLVFFTNTSKHTPMHAPFHAIDIFHRMTKGQVCSICGWLSLSQHISARHLTSSRQSLRLKLRLWLRAQCAPCVAAFFQAWHWSADQATTARKTVRHWHAAASS